MGDIAIMLNKRRTLFYKMKTTRSLKASEVQKKWWIIDATDLVCGRLASIIAVYLKGKHKASYTPHVDCGDNIIVINAEKLHFTGNKFEDKLFYWHTGHPGGIKSRNVEDRLAGKNPEHVLIKAVERMLAKGPLRNQILTHFKVYAGTEHPHAPQSPEVLDVGSMNVKNRKRAS